MPSLKDYLHLHFIVLIWGFTAILGREISIPSVELVFYRTLLALLLLALLLWLRKQSFALSPRDGVILLGTGVLLGAHWILFFAAAREATISVCLAGMATSSFWTSLLEPLVQRRRIRLLEMGLGLLVIGGLYLIFHFEFHYAAGLLMAIASAMLASAFTVINGRLTARIDAQKITFYELAGAFFSIALFLPVYVRTLPAGSTVQLAPTPMDWLYIAVLAWVCTVYAYAAAVQLLQKFSSFAMNLTVNLEPVYGILLAFMIYGDKERMTTGFYLGTVVILLSVVLYPVLSRVLYPKKTLAEAEIK